MTGITHTPGDAPSGTDRSAGSDGRGTTDDTRADAPPSEQDPLQATVHETGRFVWTHLPSVIAVSVAWFLASLPVVTVGPATVGAYRAVLSLRAGDGLDVDAIGRTLREQFVHATLLGLFPLVVLAGAVNYALAYAATGELFAAGLAVGGVYFAAYASLVLVPTFVKLADGSPLTTAVWAGYRWTAGHVVGTIVLGIVTLAIGLLTAVGTVAIVLLFGGVACAFHVAFVTGVDDQFTLSNQ